MAVTDRVSTTEKHPIYAPLIGLGLATGLALGSAAMESWAAERQTAAVEHCIEIDQQGLYSEHGFNQCVLRAHDSNNIDGLTDTIQLAGGLGMLGFGSTALAFVISEKPSWTQKEHHRESDTQLLPEQPEYPIQEFVLDAAGDSKVFARKTSEKYVDLMWPTSLDGKGVVRQLQRISKKYYAPSVSNEDKAIVFAYVNDDADSYNADELFRKVDVPEFLSPESALSGVDLTILDFDSGTKSQLFAHWENRDGKSTIQAKVPLENAFAIMDLLESTIVEVGKGKVQDITKSLYLPVAE